MKPRVHVRDVSLRDGLQLVQAAVPTEVKLEWFARLIEAGVPEVEITSFVSRKLVPQFSDAEAVVANAARIPNGRISVLCPSLRMARRGLDAGATNINFVVSASETHQRANVGRSIADSLDELDQIAAEIRDRGLHGKATLSVAISMSFGCSFEGRVDPVQVLRIGERMVNAGADELGLADTVGYATPRQVRSLFESAGSLIASDRLCGHFHDTYGTGLANIAAAVEAGVRRFDASVGGLGGCPFAPGASGNTATEDCVYLLDELGFETGISLPSLIELARRIEAWLPDERLSGRVSRLGPPRSWVGHASSSIQGSFECN